MSGTKYKQGDILLVPFPFSDLSAVKQRPILVISKNNEEDLITCAITSNLSPREHSIALEAKDLSEGTLPKESRIRVNKLFTLEAQSVKRKFGTLKSEKLAQATKEFRSLV